MLYEKKASLPAPEGHNVRKNIYFNSESLVDGPIKMMLRDYFYTFPNPEKGEMGGHRVYTKNVEFSPLDENGRGTVKYDLSQEYGEPSCMRMNGGELADFLGVMGIELDGPFNPQSIKGETAYKMR